ncbi:MAG TPA: aminopeptidase, partial [Phycisphaerae bacterium]|nr:aminopeptidase [Phycisphaerae bacterium]
ESVAVFVARTGADQFLVDRYGADSDIVRRAREDDADAERFNGFLAGLRAELEVVYAGDLSREEKIEARGPIFEAARQRVTTDLLPLVHHPEEFEHYQELAFNNAFLLVNARYNTNLDIFRAVYESVGQDWKAMMEVLRQASVSADPFGFLRQRLAP